MFGDQEWVSTGRVVCVVEEKADDGIGSCRDLCFCADAGRLRYPCASG